MLVKFGLGVNDTIIGGFKTSIYMYIYIYIYIYRLSAINKTFYSSFPKLFA
jgi:hypothetical protein